MHNPSANPEGSRLAGLGKRAIAWLVLIAAAVIILKVAFSAIMGFVVMLLTVAVVIVLIGAIFWAMRRI
jgi:hypothetical protein